MSYTVLVGALTGMCGFVKTPIRVLFGSMRDHCGNWLRNISFDFSARGLGNKLWHGSRSHGGVWGLGLAAKKSPGSDLHSSQ